ncbi:MAG: D-glycerate dehydrogenase [Candidatus Hydrothermota bacterium]|nr:MAG: D-glycerate dehydrogenase [Candidatus Hydrothermae bacterium]
MKVFVTREIPKIGLELLEKAGFEINLRGNELPPTKDELVEGVKDADALLCLLTDKISRDVLEAGKNLKIVSNYAVGYDNIDVDAATELGIIVTNTPGVLTDATAELAWALLFAVARRIVEADKFTRAGKFKGWHPTLLLGFELKGKTLGIIGAGRIGTAMALKSKGFKMKVLYFSRHRNERLERELGAKMVSLDELLKESDFVSLHVPLTSETFHLIGERELNLMKPTAILINTSRGAVVDEQALIKALQNRRIAGAGLDVFENEPEVPDELKKLENVVITPHIGSATHNARESMALMAAQAIVDVLNGRIPQNVVNPEVLKKLRGGQ